MKILFALVLALAGFNVGYAADVSGNARMNDKFIVSGASGMLGGLVVKEFLARGVPAKNLILVSRSPEKLAEYAKMGASTRYGDVDHPESLAAAYAGGTRMLMISLGIESMGTPRPPRHKLAFDAAAKAGVKQIAYTSFMGAGDPNPKGISLDHAQSEAFLRATGVPWTALRYGIYGDILLSRALKMAETGKAAVPANEEKTAPVTREDCAAVAVAALLYPGHENKGYDVTGPALIGAADIAREVEAITGKQVKLEMVAAGTGEFEGPPNMPPPGSVPPPANMPSSANMPTPMKDDSVPRSRVTNAVAELTKRPATGLREFLEAHRDELLAAAARR